MKQAHPLWADAQRAEELKQQLDELHRWKIRACDEVLVVNSGGYIGDSTRAEIAYAHALGRPIRYTDTLGHAVVLTRPGLSPSGSARTSRSTRPNRSPDFAGFLPGGGGDLLEFAADDVVQDDRVVLLGAFHGDGQRWHAGVNADGELLPCV